ncbi:hypothetical protein BDZ89DRAFT_1063143 [Hymenopellis radicata]|nr:hypothetical protein BDZ89DRAFT_1063143 [Hymenopellis radicata]
MKKLKFSGHRKLNRSIYIEVSMELPEYTQSESGVRRERHAVGEGRGRKEAGVETLFVKNKSLQI